MKERFNQKSTWVGLAAILYGLYQAVVFHDYTNLVESITTGVGLVTVNA